MTPAGYPVMTKDTKKRFRPPYKALVLAVAIVLVGGKWYTYVAHADSPFDDFGASLNAMMPGPINRIGCDMLKERFGKVPIPPKGCSQSGRWS
jgi:hypothetical protein